MTSDHCRACFKSLSGKVGSGQKKSLESILQFMNSAAVINYQNTVVGRGKPVAFLEILGSCNLYT